MKVLPVVLSISCCLAVPAGAQTLDLRIDNGRVTLEARDVTTAQILERWAQVGGITVVNADRLSERVTLRFDNVPEVVVLAALLRDVPGYMAIARAEPIGRLSTFDRILVWRGSTSSTSAPTVTTPPVTASPTAEVAPVVAVAEDPSQNPPPDRPLSFFAPATGPASGVGGISSLPVGGSQAGLAAPPVTGEAGAQVASASPGTPSVPSRATSGAAPQSADGGANNPFGATGSDRPGTIAPVPKAPYAGPPDLIPPTPPPVDEGAAPR